MRKSITLLLAMLFVACQSAPAPTSAPPTATSFSPPTMAPTRQPTATAQPKSPAPTNTRAAVSVPATAKPTAGAASGSLALIYGSDGLGETEPCG